MASSTHGTARGRKARGSAKTSCIFSGRFSLPSMLPWVVPLMLPSPGAARDGDRLVLSQADVLNAQRRLAALESQVQTLRSMLAEAQAEKWTTKFASMKQTCAGQALRTDWQAVDEAACKALCFRDPQCQACFLITDPMADSKRCSLYSTCAATRRTSFSGDTFVKASKLGRNVAAATSQFNEDTDLKQHFENVTRGPGSMKWRHYFDVYHKHLARFRNSDVHVVEIGIFAGGGLRLWRWFFGRRARIYGIDFANRTRAYERHLNFGRPDRVFIGDQADPDFWTRVKRRLPRIDVILDDGGHEPEQQEATLKSLLPHLSPGGVYLCEDVHGSNRFARAVFLDFVYSTSGINGYEKYQKIDNRSTLGVISQPSEIQQTVAEVSFYPFVIVIEKTPERRVEMVGYRRGDLWRRFQLSNGDHFAFPGTCEIPSDCPLI